MKSKKSKSKIKLNVYSDQELKTMLKKDRLPKKLAKKTAKMWADLV